MKNRFFNYLKRSERLVLLAAFTLYLGGPAEIRAAGQAKTITVELKNVSLSKAMTAIEKASGYSFFFDENKTDLNHVVNLDAENDEINRVLSELLSSTNLTYEISNNQIALIPKGNTGQLNLRSFSKTALPEVQQSRGIKGVVKDSYGETIIGASVIVKGTTTGTVTDMDGNFSLDVPVGTTLEVSYVGYLTQAVVVNSNLLSIVLKENSTQLSEVVVTGFGLSQKKATLTGAVSSIGANDLSRSVSSTTSGALVGKMPGVNSRQADGRPGSTTNIQIRNMGNPLYVIDGVQKDAGQFNNIDFNDIESVAVLKDASAAIYGVRAANGVVVVTTKKGSKNTKNTVTLNAYYGWQSLSNFPDPADAGTYVENYIQSQTIQGKTLTWDKEDLAKWQQGTEKGYQSFDWKDFIWETSPQEYVNANVSGGSDKINYYFSLGHLNQDAMIVNYGGFTRSNVQMNIESQVNDKLKLGASMNGRIEKRMNPGVPGGDDYWLPIFGTYRNLPTVRPFANDNPKYPTMTSTDAGTNFAWLNYDLSGKMEDTWRVAQLNFDAEYQIIDGLKAKGMFGYYLANRKHDNQEYTYKLYKYDEATDTYPVMFENNNPWRERTTAMVEELTTNVQLSYNKTFGDHNVAALVGLESIKRDAPSNWVHSIPASNALHLLTYETMDTYNDTGNNTEARLGWTGRVNYDFANKYLLELSARYDGSWKFPTNDRWGFFPSASVGWRISEEGFWKDSKIASVVSDLKLRGSYGMMGDDNVDGYSAFDYMSGYNYKNGGSVIDGKYTIGTEPRGLPVTTLSWIEAKILDIGFDASFFQGKLTGTFDFFQRKRTGLPASRYDVLIPSEAGFSLPKENLNSDMNLGYDASARWNDKAGDLNYSVGVNVTYSRFYDWNQYKPRFSNSWNEYRNSINERYGYLSWGLEADGQFQSWEEIASWTIDNDRQGNKTLRPGDIKYKDQNGDKVINGMDERPIGYRQGSTPVLNMGMNFSFGYKGFDLAFDLTGGALASWRQDWEQRNPFHDGGNNSQYYMENTWRLSDITDANSALIPGKYPTLLIGNSSHSNYWNSTFWMHNIRYVKLRNLEFGYTIPRQVLERFLISELRLYVSGQNLLTFANTNGTDPEIESENGLQYPTTRIVNLGLTLKF
ncbi:MAG: TonB-dependent receptor [Parabacteroides sp.]|nr:TonB-dependent receptor [Parabacteroides sp.]MDD2416346.1 TonB-dependent receptor [Parabacteroides sp.]MDD3358971.1 TonB-dependent receptor [Parabacteroides sp.]MDD4403950.1 TonB-dependent receptor [Parabacteroides sp.]